MYVKGGGKSKTSRQINEESILQRSKAQSVQRTLWYLTLAAFAKWMLTHPPGSLPAGIKQGGGNMIFCVEDDGSIRDLMIYALNSAGLEAVGFSDGAEFWAALHETTPDMVILDIMLPGEDGISILKKIRSHPVSASVPVIMATAKGTEYDKVIGLDLGADDYLSKPFGMMEMISRVKAVLRRTRPAMAKAPLRIGELELDTDEHTVRVCQSDILLTKKEYELLLTFMRRPGQVFTRENLLLSIWGSDFAGETRTVDVHIGTLRTKLGVCGEYIKTVRGVGYRMEKTI